MRISTLIIAGLLAAPAGAATPPPASEPRVQVHFIDAEHYVDASYRNRTGPDDRLMRDMAACLVTLGERYLPAGQTLEMEITDIDLAGRFEPWQANINATDVRFMRDATWPRIGLKYRLRSGNDEIAQGDETVSDPQYLMRAGVRNSSDPLRYEKAMLDEWFRRNFDAASGKTVAARKP